MASLQQTSSTYILIDAGLALELNGEALSIAGAAPVGTPPYYSPKLRLHRDLDVRSDLFSLGVTLYECATGEHPFVNNAVSRVSVLQNILELAPPSPHTFVSGLPNDLCALIARLMAKNRTERYQSPDELLADVIWKDPETGVRNCKEYNQFIAVETEREAVCLRDDKINLLSGIR